MDRKPVPEWTRTPGWTLVQRLAAAVAAIVALVMSLLVLDGRI